MKRFFKFFKTKPGHRVLFALVFSLALFIRFWKIEYIPFQSDWDEFAYIFAGQTLIESGEPVAVTGFKDEYAAPGNRPDINLEAVPELNLKGPYYFVKPWFDHPFLLPLIAGGWTKLFGYSFPSHVPSLIYRLPMLFFSGITLLLVFLISQQLFGFFPGLFSLILLGFTPSIVFVHRMVIGENLYTPLILLCLYLLLTKKSIILPILLSALAGLAKIPGLLAVPLASYLLLLKRRFKQSLIYLVASLTLFVFIYCLYGYLISWPQFIQMLKTQSYRPIGWTNPAFIFSHPGFHAGIVVDAGYYLLLILGLAGLFLPSSSLAKNFSRFTITGSLLLLWATSPEAANLGWYKIPLFTFLAISAGNIVSQKLDYSLLVLLAVTILNNLGLVRDLLHPYLKPLYLRLILLLVFTPIFFLTLLRRSKPDYKKYLFVILLAAFVISSFYVVDNFYDSLCQHKYCPLPVLTLRRLLRL